jgi:hypothetical protein
MKILIQNSVPDHFVYLLEGCVFCRIGSIHFVLSVEGVYLHRSMTLGELRETVLIVIASVVKELQKVIGVESGIMKS